MEENDIKQKAEEFARANRDRFAKEITNIEKYPPEKIPVSIFMAGSPGAGKTEFARNLKKILNESVEVKNKFINIEPDEYRPLIPGYVGNNSHLFHIAVSLITERVHDLVLKNDQSFIFDSTLSKYEKAVDNIKRSLSKNRAVIIFYVYQRPEVSWEFTLAREELEKII